MVHHTITTKIRKDGSDMQDTIKVFGEKTKEHKRLEAAAMLINAEFDGNYGEAEVKDVFWDYGGGVKWTTICFGHEYQALSPMQHAMITVGKMADFAKAVSEVMESHRKHMQLSLALRYGVKADE
jgi:hypothetical protein